MAWVLAVGVRVFPVGILAVALFGGSGGSNASMGRVPPTATSVAAVGLVGQIAFWLSVT